MCKNIGVRIGAGFISIPVDTGRGQNRSVPGQDASPDHITARPCLLCVVNVAVEIVAFENLEVSDPDRQKQQKRNEKISNSHKFRVPPALCLLFSGRLGIQINFPDMNAAQETSAPPAVLPNAALSGFFRTLPAPVCLDSVSSFLPLPVFGVSLCMVVRVLISGIVLSHILLSPHRFEAYTVPARSQS